MDVKLISKTQGLNELSDFNIEELILAQARVSTSKSDLALIENPEKLLFHCIKNGHWSIFDMVNLGFEIITSRDISAQLLRHSSIKPQEFSQRYSPVIKLEDFDFRLESKENRQSSTKSILTIENNLKDVVIKEEADPKIIPILLDAKKAMVTLLECYNKGIKAGVAKETMRKILPMNSSTRLYMNGSIRSWLTFLNVRLEKHAQLEARLIAEKIRDIFIIECPIISKAFDNFEDAYDNYFLDKLVLKKYE